MLEVMVSHASDVVMRTSAQTVPVLHVNLERHRTTNERRVTSALWAQLDRTGCVSSAIQDRTQGQIARRVYPAQPEGTGMMSLYLTV